MTLETNLGELMYAIYIEMLRIYGSEEIASVATAAVLNDLLSGGGNVEAEA